MHEMSLLQFSRSLYCPSFPPLLKDIKKNRKAELDKESLLIVDPLIQEKFPLTHNLPIVSFVNSDIEEEVKSLKVGILFSGGQAPGGHNVISGLFDALKELNLNSQLFGILDGPSGLIEHRFIELTSSKVALFRNQGGFDSIGSGRVKIETPEQFEAVAKTLTTLNLDGLVIVGGDDSNTNAAHLAEFCKKEGILTRIIGVPKTIDGDLKNPFIEIPFGFDTASKIYSEMIGNLAKDALSSKKYYFFIKIMGRSASHLTLECALQTHVNLAFIGEEIEEKKLSLEDICLSIVDLICERERKGKNFGVILIPEGLLEFIPEYRTMIMELNNVLAKGEGIAKRLAKEKHPKRIETLRANLSQSALECYIRLPEDIQEQLLLDRDPHGNIQLSKIETERLLISLIERELSVRLQKGEKVPKFNAQPLFYGYEGRCGLPTNFDCNYCYSLGRLAALLILQGASGYMCCLKNLTQETQHWKALGIPIVQMLHMEMRKNKRQAVIKKALVDLKGPVFEAFKQQREGWKYEDSYKSPGPIQFNGPRELVEQLSLTLLLEQKSFNLNI